MTEVTDVKILDDIQHCLLRPGMYIGPITTEKKEFWVPTKDKMVLKEIDYIPGLYKIFCEVLDNAIDEHQRGFCNQIQIEIDSEKGSYCVKDNGRGISPDKHECGKHTPEVVFTMLRSGSNFDDEARETIGMNGVGAALTNIFSTKFVVNVFRDNKHYMQTFRNNNRDIDVPVIRKKKARKTGTHITFYPDQKIFKKRLNPILIYKRCMELAYAFPELTIKLDIDGKKKDIQGKKFRDFAGMFGDVCLIHTSKHFKYGVVNTHGEGFSQFSIVNGADTWRGGIHIDVLKEAYVNVIREHIKKKCKKNKIEPTYNDVAKYLHFVVICNMNAPQFDGQTKEKLSNDKNEILKIAGTFDYNRFPKALGSILEECVESVNLKLEAKDNAELRKAQKLVKAQKIPKLIDCSTRSRMNATLYITEGDSAVSGISSVRDPKIQAGLPLRGKILNVSGMTPKKIIENKEIQTLMSAIGLEIGKLPIKYMNGKVVPTTLRYGNISILTDADHDGSAIRCLLINFFYRFWPELFRHEIVTISEAPLYEVYNSRDKKTRYFYEKEDYEEYMKGKTSSCKVSYFKGLGSCDKSCWNYFINKSPKMYAVSIDEVSDDKLIMAFANDTDKRKEWLR